MWLLSQGGRRRLRQILQPGDPAKKILRAFNIETGKAEWQIDMPGPVQSNYAGVLTTRAAWFSLAKAAEDLPLSMPARGKYLLAFRDQPSYKGLADDVRSGRPAVCGDRIGRQTSFRSLFRR